MQLEQLHKLFSTGTSEDLILALKIIENKITIEHAIAAACLIRTKTTINNNPDAVKNTLLYLQNLLSDNNEKLDVIKASPSTFFSYALRHMRSEEDIEYAYEWYKDYINQMYISAVVLKLPARNSSK